MILKILQGQVAQWREVAGVWTMVEEGKLKVFLGDSDDPSEPEWILPATDSVAVYLMNENGKTVDMVWPQPATWIELDDGSVVKNTGDPYVAPKYTTG